MNKLSFECDYNNGAHSEVLKRIIETIFADGIPFYVWLWGSTFPVIALGVIIFSVWFMFKKHKEPKRFVITEANAQKYYDTIMITNSLLRILALFALVLIVSAGLLAFVVLYNLATSPLKVALVSFVQPLNVL